MSGEPARRDVTPRSNLPSLRLDEAAWEQAPPDPLAAPELYDGLIWRRVVGYGVDVVAIGVLALCLGVAFSLAGLITFGLLTPLGVLALALLPVAYHTYFVGRRGATPGMALFDVEVRAWTGRRVDVFQAFLVTVLFYTSVAATSFLILLVALFNERRRTLHDYLAGTVAIRRSRRAPLGAGSPV